MVDDAVFRAHWLGEWRAGRPSSAFDLPKMACLDPDHKSCGDCLRALWYHDRIRINGDRGCGVCRAMRLTIAMRRGAAGQAEFAEFDAWIRGNLDFVCRAVDARHLVSFITNYAEHGSGPERAAAAAALWINMAEKVSTSTPPRAGVLDKVESWPVSDGRFVAEGSFAHPASNFTMFDWDRGDAMSRTVQATDRAMRDAPVVRRLTMAVLGWAMLYGVTSQGTVLRRSPDRGWARAVVDRYMRG